MSIVKFKTAAVSKPVLIVEKEERVSARKSPRMVVKVLVTEDDKVFEDSMILDSAIPKASYKVFMRMQKVVPNINEISEMERQESYMDLMLDNFSEFILPMIVSCNFEKNL